MTSFAIASDCCSKKKILQVIHTAHIVGYTLLALASLLKSLFVALLGLTLPAFAGSVLPILKTIIAECSKKGKRANEFAKIALIKGSMTVLGPLLGLIISRFSFSIPYFSSFLFATFLSFLALLCTSMQNFFFKPSILFKADEEKTTSLEKNHFKILSVFFFIFLCYCLFIKFAPLTLVQRFENNTDWISYLFVICGLSGVFNQFFSFRFLHLTSRSIPLLLIALFISILCLCFLSSPFTSLFFLFTTLFCLSLVTVQIESHLSLLASLRNQGKIQGLLFSVENASYLAAPLIVALFATYNPLYSIECAALISAIALFIYLRLEKAKPNQLKPTSRI